MSEIPGSLDANKPDVNVDSVDVGDGDAVIPDDAVAQFLNGIQAGPMELPADSVAVLADQPITSDLASGTEVSYQLAMDANPGYKLLAKADGSGGIQNINHRFFDTSGSFSLVGYGNGNWNYFGNMLYNARIRYKRTGVLTSNTTITNHGQFVGVDSSGGTITVTLDSTIKADGAWVTVKDEGGAAGTNAITVDTSGTGTIDGSSSISIASNYGSVDLYTDGTNWFTR